MATRLERMKERAKTRTDNANGAAKQAYCNVWIKVGTAIRDELPLLRGAPLSVLVYLASRMDKKYQCNPGVKLIARQTGYSERWVQVALAYLKEVGFIDYEPEGDKWHSDRSNRQPSNVYTLTKRYRHDGKAYPLFEYGKHNGTGDDSEKSE